MKPEKQTLQVINELHYQISDCTIELICQHGLEQLSFSQVAVTANLTVTSIYKHFDSVENLVTYCLQRSFSSLVNYISFSICRSNTTSIGIEVFWEALIEFNRIYVYRGELIYRYLKRPTIFPTLNVKDYVIESVDQVFNVMGYRFKNSNMQIRFIAFNYLYQMANKLAVQLPASDEAPVKDVISNYFHNKVENDLIKLLDLPIY